MIRPDDVVRVGYGPDTMHALVLRTAREGMTRGHLLVLPLCGRAPAGRDVLTRDVTAHWRRVRVRASAAA